MARLAGTRGKILSTRETPYNLLEIMQDPSFLRHFLVRFKISHEIAESLTKKPVWFFVYKNKPELFYYDALDEVKRCLGKAESSASTIPFLSEDGSAPIFKKIVLEAVGDWICEKEGREIPFERIPNTVKAVQINYKSHYAWKQKHAKDKDRQAGSAVDLGSTRTPVVRKKSRRRNETP